MSISTLLPGFGAPSHRGGGILARAYIGRCEAHLVRGARPPLVQDADGKLRRNARIAHRGKGPASQEKNLFEKEMRERGRAPGHRETPCFQKEESLDGKSDQLEKREKTLQHRELENQEKEEELKTRTGPSQEELERISGLTTEEAKALLLKNLENDVRFESIRLINKIEEEAKRTAEKKAKEIVLAAIQRNASDFTSECTITTVSLPPTT